MKRNLKGRSEARRSLEIEASELKEKLDNKEDVLILDVRTQEEHDAWKLSYDKYQKTPVMPIDKLVSSKGMAAKQIPKDKEIVTVCSHGMRSQAAAQMLSKMGYNVRSIRGGMAAWNQVYDTAEVPVSRTASQTKLLRIWQLRRVSKGCMAYVISSGSAATIIDCTCDLDNSILKLAEEHGLKIKNVIDTHMHADHVSGLSMLAKKTGAQAYIGADEGYEPAKNLGIAVSRIGDGEKIPIGDGISLVAIHTPGHTLGSMSFLLKVDSEAEEKSYLYGGYHICEWSRQTGPS